ncbi:MULTISPECIES: hypothetical protein [unclassified Granulicatella]|uniref:hypothetical protein n=1 Tax=unclassified Granulicatella TaxID=2630493 RepID=UPI001ADD6598|nr:MULTISPECIES: hypothetical protein [unclassified Granulicatella]
MLVPLFELARQLYPLYIYAYYFDLPFNETLKRHETREKAKEFGVEVLKCWWIEKDYAQYYMKSV